MTQDARAITAVGWVIAAAIFGAADKKFLSALCFAAAAIYYYIIWGINRGRR